jgi:hypothetical protein
MGRFFRPIYTKTGRLGVGVLYFTVPLVVGYFVKAGSDYIARRNLGERGEKLLALKAKRDFEEGGAAGAPRLYMATPPPVRKPAQQNDKLL